MAFRLSRAIKDELQAYNRQPAGAQSSSQQLTDPKLLGNPLPEISKPPGLESTYVTGDYVDRPLVRREWRLAHVCWHMHRVPEYRCL